MSTLQCLHHGQFYGAAFWPPGGANRGVPSAFTFSEVAGQLPCTISPETELCTDIFMSFSQVLQRFAPGLTHTARGAAVSGRECLALIF